MTGFAILGALLLATEPAAVAPSPPADAHQQHQASGQHQAGAAASEHCCCEEMMRDMHKMMMEMMGKHQGMAGSQPANASEPPKPEEHKH